MIMSFLRICKALFTVQCVLNITNIFVTIRGKRIKKKYVQKKIFIDIYRKKIFIGVKFCQDGLYSPCFIKIAILLLQQAFFKFIIGCKKDLFGNDMVNLAEKLFCFRIDSNFMLGSITMLSN